MTTVIEWAKYFDRIFCVFFLPNKERMERIQLELQRVGILDSEVFEWRFTVPSQLDKRIQDSYTDKKWIESIGAINGAIEQTRIMKESLLLGYKRILILEDDVAFLKDLSLVKDILDNLPEDYDIIQCDKGVFKCDLARWESTCKNSINPVFAECKEHHFGLSDANIYTRNGLAEAVRILEAKPIFVDQIWRYGNFKWAVAKQSLCIQVFFGTSNCNANKKIHEIYSSVGTDYKKYSLPSGYGYGDLYNPWNPCEIKVTKTMNHQKESPKEGRWDRFGYIGVVCYTGYKDRVETLKPELARVGLIDKVHFHWDFPSAFTNRLSSVVRKTPFCSKPGCFNMLVMHYDVVKTAYELGCESVLVLEDDMRFLKDLNAIDEILASIPFGYDHLMFDRNVDQPEELERLIQDGKNHSRNTWIRFFKGGSTGCYAFSRRGMRHYIELIEYDLAHGKVHNPDWYFWDVRKGKILWDESYNRYCPYPNLAVQGVTGKQGSFTNLHEFYWIYLIRGGIKQEDYNLDFPIVTKDNFKSLLCETLDMQDHGKRNGIGFCGDNAWVITSREKNCTTEITQGTTFDRSFIWGLFYNEDNVKSLQVALCDKAQLIICEIGLIFGMGKNDGHSFIADNRGALIDVKRRTMLEEMLEDRTLIVSDEQMAEARRLIDKIVKNKITTYNSQPIHMHDIGRPNTLKVLVVDQLRNPMLEDIADVTEHDFMRMLQTAIEENPNADIIIKAHPDTGSGTKGYLADIESKGNIYVIDSSVNPYCLFDICDKVYVCFSNMGLEALMAGKEVHTFGMPFYAGWGLTIDYKHLDRRTNNRTLEELFYIYCIMYTHWVDPDKGCETTIDAVVDKMIALRKEYKRCKHRGQFQQSVRNKPTVTLHDSSEPFAARVSCPTRPLTLPMPYHHRGIATSRGFVGGEKRNGLGMFF